MNAACQQNGIKKTYLSPTETIHRGCTLSTTKILFVKLLKAVNHANTNKTDEVTLL